MHLKGRQAFCASSSYGFRARSCSSGDRARAPNPAGFATIKAATTLLPSVLTGEFAAPVLVLLLSPGDPLLGTAIALLGAGAAAAIIGIYVSRRILFVTWPARRVVIAVALGVPLGLMGHVLGSMLGELTAGKAMLALVLSTAVMLLLQYAIGKNWLREVRPVVEAAA